MSEFDSLFLDANALASPVTRTLLIAGARADAMRVVWSAEEDFDNVPHLRAYLVLGGPKFAL